MAVLTTLPRGRFSGFARKLKDGPWLNWLPRTLMARSVLIIVTPLIMVQVISTIIFYDNHWETMSRRLAQGIAGDITHIRVFMRDYPDPEDFVWIERNARLTMLFDIDYEADAVLPPEEVIDGDGPFPDVLTLTLWREMRRPFTIDVNSSDQQVEIKVQLPDGVLGVHAPRKRLFSSTTYVFVLWMIGSSLLLFGVAAIFLRNQVSSVQRLASAADNFGKGRDVPDFKPEGALEVRQAARAFNVMRNRLRRQIDQRTEMLAGVSHDLRTPLTRMRLQLEMLRGADVADVTAIKEDIDDMQRMLDGYLSFARGEGQENAEPTDLPALLDGIEQRVQREGGAITMKYQDLEQPVTLKPIAFQRCLTNLVSNASRYGARVEVTARRTGSTIEIHVDDDGPGIPEDRREDVFKAFQRLEPSRNPETGGIGLGLTIARDAARGLGGDIVLGESPLGGLRATVRLPV